MAKVWKEHPMYGKTVTYLGTEGCTVVDVKPGPMLAELDFGATDFVMRGTIKLRIKYPGGAKVWSPPMEYKAEEPTNDQD